MLEHVAAETKTCPNCARTYGRIGPSGRRIAGKEWSERVACSRKCAWAVRKARGYSSEGHHWRRFTPEQAVAMVAAYRALPRGPSGRCKNNARQALEAKWGCSKGYISDLARRGVTPHA